MAPRAEHIHGPPIKTSQSPLKSRPKRVVHPPTWAPSGFDHSQVIWGLSAGALGPRSDRRLPFSVSASFASASFAAGSLGLAQLLEHLSGLGCSRTLPSAKKHTQEMVVLLLVSLENPKNGAVSLLVSQKTKMAVVLWCAFKGGCQGNSDSVTCNEQT